VRARTNTLLASEAGLALVTAAAIVGMHRLFADGSYRPALLAQALVAHAAVALLRRVGLSLPVAAVVSLAAAALALTWGHYLDTTVALLPTGDTLAAIDEDLSAAWRLFQDVDAPAPPTTGFLMAGGAAVWVMVFVADWAAFRASATFEALLPSATLFLFAAALGAPGGRVAGATVYAAAAMLFVLLRRTLDQERSSAWAATHRSRGRWSLIGTGCLLIVVAVGAGSVAGPNLPGADGEAVINWRDVNGGVEPRVVVSPMVDIRARMVEQPDVELFTVRSAQPEYWRLTALDQFDGRIWKSSYGTDDADGELPRAVPTDVEITEVRQEFAISALAAVWLPAAYEPVAIDAGGSDVNWDEPSSTLMVDRDVDSSDALSYEVSSNVPNWTAERLREASGAAPDDIREQYLALPDDINPAVRDLAEEWTAGVTNPYDRAMALQAQLRTFTYNLDAPVGHDGDALSAFLFESREGYCEQFAGAFAVLARSIGLPTRVAVGFSPGIQDQADPTLWRVRGEHAHAWAEVYFDGIGWVLFDPTPGRAPPGAQEWLGVPPQQDAPGGTGDETTTPSTVPAPAPAPGPQQPTDGVEAGRAPLDGGGVAAGGEDGGDSPVFTPVTRAVRTGGTGLGLAALAYLLIVPLAVAATAVLRRRRASTTTARARLAWLDVLDRARAVDTALPPSLTINEAAGELAQAFPEQAPAIGRLAEALERATYAEVPPSPDEVAALERARDELVGAVGKRQGTLRRVLRYLDVRELWRRRPGGARRTAHAA
jgi:transglutaminase-like putative cysteine protease